MGGGGWKRSMPASTPLARRKGPFGALALLDFDRKKGSSSSESQVAAAEIWESDVQLTLESGFQRKQLWLAQEALIAERVPYPHKRRPGVETPLPHIALERVLPCSHPAAASSAMPESRVLAMVFSLGRLTFPVLFVYKATEEEFRCCLSLLRSLLRHD